MTISKQDESHRRGATRAPVDRPIKLQFDDSMEVIEGTCRNVSIGGMFILYEHSRPAGSLVRFELELDDSNAIRGLGEVVWMRSKNDFGGPEAGFGLKFRFLEQRDRQQIFKLVSQHIKERLSKRGESEEPPAPSASPPTPSASPPTPSASPPTPSASPPAPSASPLTPPEPLATPPAAPSPPTLAAFPDVDEALAAPSAPAPSAAPPSALPDVDAALAAAELPPADNEGPTTAHESLDPIASGSGSDRPASERAVTEASSAEEDLLGSTDTPLAREVWQPPPPVAGDAQVDPGLLDGSPPAV
ncbi:MAG: PilZ domain-containing protein, partial [Acidobacteriota bacterium]